MAGGVRSGVSAGGPTDVSGLMDRPHPGGRDDETLRHDIAAGVLCAAVLGLALLVGHLHRIGGFGVETDFYGAYAVQARNLLEGRPYTYPHQPPGYPLLLAGASVLFGDLFVAAKVLSAVAAAAFGWITYLLFKALFGSRIALASTMLLLPATFGASFLAASDLLGALFKLLPFWVLLRRSSLTPKAGLLAGVLAGIAYLVRYNAIVIGIGLSLSLLMIGLHREPLRNRMVQATLFACGAILITAPWLIVNWRTNGSPFASTGYLLVATHFYMPDQSDRLSAAVKEPVPAEAVGRLDVAKQFHSFTDVVAHDPAGFLEKYLGGLFSNAWRLGTEGLGFPASLVAPMGLVLLLRDRSRRRVIYLLVCLVGYLSLGLVAFHLRFYYFLFPLGFLSVAYLLVGWLPATRRIRAAGVPVGWVLVLVSAASLAASAYRQTSNAIASEPRYLIEIGDFLRQRSSPGEIVIARKPHLAYLAGLINTFPFVRGADDYLAEARRRRARYLVYSGYEAQQWPGLKSLRDPRAAPAGLTLIYVHPQSETLIYEVNSSTPEEVKGVGNNSRQGR
jgi:4-amino-4-deoxy-L-arabinose transferase-like glycosyltransferase